MILAAELAYSESTRLMLGRHSGIGNRIPRFPFFCRETGRESPIPDLAGKQGTPGSRFGRERESGSRFAGPGISWSELEYQDWARLQGRGPRTGGPFDRTIGWRSW